MGHLGGESLTAWCDHWMCLSYVTTHLGLGLHLPEGVGESGEEPQAGDHRSHQVICQLGRVEVTQVAPKTLSCYSHIS